MQSQRQDWSKVPVGADIDGGRRRMGTYGAIPYSPSQLAKDHSFAASDAGFRPTVNYGINRWNSRGAFRIFRLFFPLLTAYIGSCAHATFKFFHAVVATSTLVATA